MNPRFDDRSFTVAIVGCGGFIGSHLLDAVLCRTKWRVFGVDLDFYRETMFGRKRHIPEMLSHNAQIRAFGERTAMTAPRNMGEAPAVIRSNYDHPAALADACAKSGSWLIHFSTSEVYGRTGADSGVLDEDSTPLVFGPVTASRWSYATAKLLTERYIAGLSGLKWTVVRPFNFVGPYMDYMPGVDGEGIPRVLANFSTALLRGEPLKLVNGGKAKRCFTSVHDAIDFLFALFDAGSGTAQNAGVFSQVFNVGNAGNELSIAELAQKMRQIYAEIRGVDIATLPEPQVVAGEEYYGTGYDDSMRRLPGVEKAERLLGFRASTPIDVCLRESLTWFVKHYSV